MPRQEHNTTASFETRAPASFKRLLGGPDLIDIRHRSDEHQATMSEVEADRVL